MENSIVEEIEGDIFGAPEHAVLMHACSCLGSWGAGIAKAFKDKYPAAYRIHHNHCKSVAKETLVGTCQLIPPQDDYEKVANVAGKPPQKRRRVRGSDDGPTFVGEAAPCRKHWIACLLTSIGYGKPTKNHAGVDKPDEVLKNTGKALVDLKEQLLKLRVDDEESKETVTGFEAADAEVKPGELWSCKFNSGLFAVEWTDSKKILEEELRSLGETVRVVSRSTP